MTGRRAFLTRMGAAAATLAIDPTELRAEASAAPGAWDTSWIDRLATAKYRVVFNGNVIDDGAVMDYAATFIEHYREVHDTAVTETRPVVVFRRLGTQMALNDHLWERFAIGADLKIKDPVTGSPAQRNVFWRSTGSSASSNSIESMHQRGMISLVCNVSLGSIGRRLAEQSKRDIAEVQAEVRANLVPGAIAVPSGIYALIRAQHAGCAFMLGT